MNATMAKQYIESNLKMLQTDYLVRSSVSLHSRHGMRLVVHESNQTHIEENSQANINTLYTGSIAVASRMSDNGRDSGSVASDGSCQGQGPSERDRSQQFCSGA